VPVGRGGKKTGEKSKIYPYATKNTTFKSLPSVVSMWLYGTRQGEKEEYPQNKMAVQSDAFTLSLCSSQMR